VPGDAIFISWLSSNPQNEKSNIRSKQVYFNTYKVLGG